MSSSFNVYCKNLSTDLAPKIVKRLNDFDMIVEAHPDFKFERNVSGFRPFKFRLKKPYFDKLKNKDLISGFEIYFTDFNWQEAKEDLKPKLSFFDKLLGKKQPDIEWVEYEIEKRSKDCDTLVFFCWHSNDIFEFRFAAMTSAILAELTNGVCCHQDGTLYDSKNIVDEAYKRVIAYEKSIKEKDFYIHEFEGWL